MRTLLPALLLGLLLGLPRLSFAQVRFGLTGDINTHYAAGVMGGGSQAGSGIPRHATAEDNVVVTRAWAAPGAPILLPVLTAEVTPEGGVILPPVLLVSAPLPADQSLVPFSPAGTVATRGAY